MRPHLISAEGTSLKSEGFSQKEAEKEDKGGQTTFDAWKSIQSAVKEAQTECIPQIS